MPTVKKKGCSFFETSLRDLQDLTAAKPSNSTSAPLTANLGTINSSRKGKMEFLTITFCLFICVYDSSGVDIMPKLKRNILNFGYGVNFKYEGMISHSFDRFYVVTKFDLPKVEDLKLITVDFDLKCSYLSRNDTYHTKLINYCLKIAPMLSFKNNSLLQPDCLQHFG